MSQNKDFGLIHKERKGISVEKLYLLLCEKNKEKKIVFRHVAHAYLGGSVSYSTVPAKKVDDMLEKLLEISKIIENE